MATNGNDGMLAALRKVLAFQMTIAEWLGTAALLAVPYLLVGVVWVVVDAEYLAGTNWTHRIVLILATMASWPALLVSNTHFA